MKKAKSLLAIWLALVLTLILFPTALADDQTHTVTYDPSTPDHITYTSSPATTTANQDLVFEFTVEEGYTYDVGITIGDASYNGGTDVQGATASERIYTIPSADLTDDVVISLSATQSTDDSGDDGSAATAYTITFADGVDDAEIEVPEPQTVDADTPYTLTAPTRSGYVFLGWSDGTTTYEAGTVLTVDDLTSDITLTAQWAQSVAISFDSGTSSSTSGIPSDTSGAAGSSYTLPTSEPRRNSGSYEFTGWEYSEDGGVYDAGETVTLPDGGTTAVTFTAQWAYRTYPDYDDDDDDDDSSSSSSSDDEYTIRATASDGGYVSPSGTTYVDEGDDLTITFAPYSGYVIDGVYIDGVLDNSHDGSYTFRDVDEDHTLYVRYIADTGSGSSGSSGDSDTSPKTGDASAPLSMGLGFGSLALIALLVARRMRRA